MVFTNKLKDCLVKIKVAQYEKKKIVLVKVSSVNLNLLDMLWKQCCKILEWGHPNNDRFVEN